MVDTAAGITEAVLTFCQAAQDALVVVCDEPASITDAYALIKVLARERGVTACRCIANMVRARRKAGTCTTSSPACASASSATSPCTTSARCRRTTGCASAVQRQQPVVMAYPGSPSARAMAEIARASRAGSRRRRRAATSSSSSNA